MPHQHTQSPQYPSLKRPKLLVRAARYGARRYKRDRDLRRLRTEDRALPPMAQLQEWLLEEEAALDLYRRTGIQHYNVHRHITVLAAILAERSRTDEDPAGDPSDAKGQGATDDAATVHYLTPVEELDQPNASGSEALRSETKASSASTFAGSIFGGS